jgi:poly(3-hydroxybutyrate) depolymerase
MSKKNWIVLVCLFVFLAAGRAAAGAEGAAGDARAVPTGLLALPDYRHPVYLYVPESYTTERDYPFIISIPDEGQTPDQHMQYWVNVANRRMVIILSVTNLWPDDMPTRMDEWLLRIKKDVSNRYRVDKRHTYLVGLNGGAHYAAYLAMAHPSEFTAVALLGAAWEGKFEKLIHPSSQVDRQIPFYVVFERNALPDVVEQAEQTAMNLAQKGYRISLVQFEGNESFSDMEFKLGMLDWLGEKSDDWGRKMEEEEQSWKGKVRSWFWRNVNP